MDVFVDQEAGSGRSCFRVISPAASGIELPSCRVATARDWSRLCPVSLCVATQGRRARSAAALRSAAFEREWLSDLAAQHIPMLRCTLGANAYELGATSLVEALQSRAHA